MSNSSSLSISVCSTASELYLNEVVLGHVALSILGQPELTGCRIPCVETAHSVFLKEAFEGSFRGLMSISYPRNLETVWEEYLARDILDVL